jgi:two-component system sensor histidine kinase KdpD
MKLKQYIKLQHLSYLACLFLVFTTTLFGEVLKRFIEPTNIVMFYLLIVVLAAIRWGIGQAIFTSTISVIAFDFFLIRPYLTLGVEDLQYLFTFSGLMFVGIVVSTYASKVREQVIQSQTERLYSVLLSSISHDLKTPLVSITGSLTTLLDKRSNLNEKQKQELLRTSCAESERMNRLVNNLLDMTRMEAGALRLSKSPCDLRDLIGTCLEQLKDIINSRKVVVEIPKDLPEISVDIRFMMKVFLNLVDNALKYSPAERPILIQAHQVKDMVHIEFKDQGCGIPKEDLKRIFEKFSRVERASQVPGTGLGLCIAKGIVEAHSGQITVESELGKGSVFTVILPVR